MSRSSTALAAPSTITERPARSATPAMPKQPASLPSDPTKAWIQKGIEGLDKMASDETYRKKVAQGRR